MAVYADLKLTHRIFMQSYPFWRYATTDNPCVKLAKPLSKCKFALVTTSGLRMENDEPFDHSNKLGDVSFREIPNETEVQDLIEDHKSTSFDHSGVQADKNLAFPLDRLRELVENKTIKSLNKRHFSFMGSIINPRKLIDETAPKVAELLRKDAVECVFLTPV